MRRVLLATFLYSCLALGIEPKAIEREQADNRKVVVCYFSSWATYRPGDGKFDVEDIDPYVCTHLVYAFAGLQSYDNTIYIMDPYNDVYDNWGKGAYERFTGLKKINPILTTTLGIGGWNEGSGKYSTMAADPAKRKSFIDSTVALLLKYNFDGLDMDWEYPANREGAKPEDKENYVTLMKELKEAFQPHGLILTAAVSAGKSTIDTAYNVPEISKYVDFFHVMGYDYHGAWDKFTGHNAPMYRNPGDVDGDYQYFNLDYSVKYWLELGAPKEKLVIGMPTYGRGWVLDHADQTGMYAPATNGIPAGPYTREAGIWGYNEICERALSEVSQWTIVRDQYANAPYAYNPSNRWWIGYDDRKSLEAKVELIKAHDLAGGMIWSIETDDFRGKCHGEKYPLLTAINLALNGDIIKPTYPPTTTTTRDPTAPTETTTKATTHAPPPDGICQKQGFVADPDDCTVFYECVANGEEWIIYTFHCQAGTVYDPVTNTCTWPYLVPGCENTLARRKRYARPGKF